MWLQEVQTGLTKLEVTEQDIGNKDRFRKQVKEQVFPLDGKEPAKNKQFCTVKRREK